MMKKYQIFVSSTYNDLIEERQIAIKAIINQRQIPAGMELFGPMGEKQWDHIKREIDQSDYYLLIVAGKYGSINEQGISYIKRQNLTMHAAEGFALSRSWREILKTFRWGKARHQKSVSSSWSDFGKR